MTYSDALGAVILSVAAIVFAAWYLRCIHTMFFRCYRPSNFFSDIYPESGLFMIVNFVAFILAAAAVLVKLTN